MGGEPRIPPKPKPIVDEPQPASSSARVGSDAPEAATADKIRARHLLIRYSGGMGTPSGVTRTKAQARERASEARQRALQGEDFELLVQEYSDDLASAARGGDLGEFSRDMMVQEFGDAAFSLKPGETSDVVESPYGFHVIQRTE
jgi:parvulin-like peptidyl-prolyl isomerase